MEINPYESRLRMLQQMDGVQMQREAAPDDETAGCPGCPYFWTCPVPHKGEEVRAPQEIELEDVSDQLPARGEYRPRDESDIGWTDVWIEDDDIDDDSDGAVDPGTTDGSPGADDADEKAEELRTDPEPSPALHGRRAGERRSLFRRRRD